MRFRRNSKSLFLIWAYSLKMENISTILWVTTVIGGTRYGEESFKTNQRPD